MPVGFPLDSYGICMIFLWISMIFLLGFSNISMGLLLGFLLDSCGISMGFPWWFFGTSLGFQRVWDSKGMSMDLYQISMGSLW